MFCCVDTNQCASGNGGCAQNCIDMLPRYECSCNDGFTLSTDGHNCTGEEENLHYSIIVFVFNILQFQVFLRKISCCLMDINIHVFIFISLVILHKSMHINSAGVEF